jgi:hypothetical protein
MEVGQIIPGIVEVQMETVTTEVGEGGSIVASHPSSIAS